MRASSTVSRSLLLGVVAGLVAVMLSATLALAKGESAGIVTLAAPIARDADPGSTLTVDFTAKVTDANGDAVPLRGTPVVLKLVGPDGTATEAVASERGTPGSYTATIEVPAGGITSAVFGLRGSALMPDGTSSLQDVPFDVDGLLFTTAAHPIQDSGSAVTRTPSGANPDYGVPIATGLALLAVGAGLIVVVSRRRRPDYA